MLLAALACTVSAATVQLTGNVTNAAGKPVKGAIVLLAGQNLKDTTDANGAYSIVNATPVLQRNSSPAAFSVALRNGILTVKLPQSSPVLIDLFDMQGKHTGSNSCALAPAGDYSFNVGRHPAASQMTIVRVTAGTGEYTFRYLPFKTVLEHGNSIAAAMPGLQKNAAIVDSLKVSASGYMTATKQLSSYEGQMNVTLDTMSLAKFSFFVTSLAGLQALAKNDSGFGGDFRFGKTGQGAGLLGADSICQCLAERSMPGSKVKQWRAFLSVVKGPDGNQVNAIDRIGNGPWYDRLGRLLANQRSELTAGARPANADAAIKNDLPNEDGVPNHRPDPNKAQVDNHMTVTGSDSTGKLFYGSLNGLGTGGPGGRDTTGVKGNATCNDWTSTTKDFKARCGLSWPQAMGGGMKNWISQMNTAGCEAGIDLNEKTGPGVSGVYTIGNGGGYGGFYCFALNP
jgi:hypothetical protein